MKAAVVTENQKIVIADVPIPEPQPDEVRIKVELTGVCGSDSSLFQGKFNVPLPVTGGHEAVGRIDKIGREVSEFRQGQRVTIHPNFSCGTCQPCSVGLPNICKHKIRLGIDTDGVFAEYVTVPAKQVYLIPDDLPNEIAIFTEPLSVIVHAMKITAPKKSDRVLIFGAGVMGLIALQMVSQFEAEIVACDLEEKRLNLAKKLGANGTIGPKDSFDSFHDRFDVIYETSGAPEALATAIRLAAPRGKIVVLGLPAKEHPLSVELIVRKELQIIGSIIYTDEFLTSIELLQAGRINTRLLTSGRFSLNELSQVLLDFRSPDRVKTLIEI